MQTAIEAKGLRKQYGDFTAVKGISFAVEKGEIFGFLGPNGAGKTTTINMLIGMAKITAGTVEYHGEDLTNHIKKAQSLIGVVPDESNLYEEMTGFENLVFCAGLYGIGKKTAEPRARELLSFFKLEDSADKIFKKYSKGMKRKLTIAAALMHNPEILFLDEPTTGIDISAVRQIRELIRALNDSGMTVFLTTHYIEEAERLCDRVALIASGEIVALDTVDNLIEQVRISNTVEIGFSESTEKAAAYLSGLKTAFPGCGFAETGPQLLKVTSETALDIAPILGYLSSQKAEITEARLLRPSLEDAFMRLTGVEIINMKKEKERK